MRKFLVMCLAVVSGGSLYAQQPRESRMADSLFKALQTHESALLLPLLEDSCNISGLPKGMNDRLIPAILEKFPAISSYKIKSIEPEGDFTRVRIEMMYQTGKPGAPDFVIGKTGRIHELNIIKNATIGGPAKPKAPVRVLEAPDTLTIPFVYLNGLIYVEGQLDGRNGFFLLDTGSPEMILNQQYFQDSLMPMPENSGGVTGINGAMQDVLMRKVNVFSLGAMQLRSFGVMVMPDNIVDLGDASMPYLGSIGYSIIKDFEVQFDMKAEKLFLVKTDSAGNYVSTSYKAPAAKATAAFTMRRHIPIVQMNVGDRTYNMGIDCGAANNVFFDKNQAALTPYMDQFNQTSMVGQEGVSTPVTQAHLKKATIGKLPFTDMLSLITPNNMSYSNDAERLPLDGLLGTEFLKCYTTAVNFKKGQVYFR
ncbi:pepsin/retropepsin-like aspartic protease family protein [Filimonas lacunae]|nr:aspartyl protease family protein [Filimonas lacunae]